MEYQSDYILRLIEQMGALIRRAMERLGASDNAAAYEFAGQAISEALDVDPELVDRLSPASLRSLVELANLDSRAIVLVADAFDLQSLALERSGSLLEAQAMRQNAELVRGLGDPGRAN